MWNLKKKCTKELIYKTEIRVIEVFYYRNRKETYGYQRMRRERDKLEDWD